jgi:hypothetical protein
VNAPRVLKAVQVLLIIACLSCAGCATTGETSDEGEPYVVSDESAPEAAPDAQAKEGVEGEVPLAVAESEPPPSVKPAPAKELEEVVVQAVRERHEVILDLVSQAQALLRNVKLDYVFTRKGRKEVLRGRPVAFALWSESKKAWSIAQIEIPRPPIKWKPGGKPLPFIVRTPGVEAWHVKGTGAERLMFGFSKDGEQMKVYGRKFPVFDNALVARKSWRAVVETAKPIVYLPFNEDTLDPRFVSGGTEFLLDTARKAMAELRTFKAASVAFPGELLADVVPPEVITTLAVIEQTDDRDFVDKKEEAFNEVLSQYGLKRDEAYRYSVSRAAALGPMQFTNKKGKGTYAMVVRRCPAANLDPNFERGATNLLNAMKAAVCLFDIELAQMPSDIRAAYHTNREVLGIFPVAAYNGGPRNVAKLYGVVKRMGLGLEDLRPQGEQPDEEEVKCPCLWTEDSKGDVYPLAIPKYNNENRWYIEKYQSILKVFQRPPAPG